LKIKRYEWIADRVDLLGFEIGAEVGTGKGITAEYLLENCPKLMLYQIVYYNDGNSWSTQGAKELWRERIKPYLDRVIILNGKSTDVYKQVEDESLDFVFIDADHSYKMCLEDIRIWYSKVRRGGLVCGHDYQNGRWKGVEKAVRHYFADEFKFDKRNKSDFMWWHWKKGENEVTKSRSKD